MKSLFIALLVIGAGVAAFFLSLHHRTIKRLSGQAPSASSSSGSSDSLAGDVSAAADAARSLDDLYSGSSSDYASSDYGGDTSSDYSPDSAEGFA